LREAGGSSKVQQSKILQSDLRGEIATEGNPSQERGIAQGASVSKVQLPNVRNKGESPSSSHRQESEQQQTVEPNDTLHRLSHAMALAEHQWASPSDAVQSLRVSFSRSRTVPEALSSVQEVWRSLTDEEKKWVALHVGPRIYDGLNHNRVAQLKAAVNDIVPEVAAIFMQAILQTYRRRT
jgi:hypothetical protein